MKIHPVEQGTEAWLEIRKGRITASEVGAFAIADKTCKLTIPEIKKELDSKQIDYKKSATKPELEKLCSKAFIAKHTRHSQTTIDARSALYAKKIAELSGAVLIDQYETLAMQRGKELEPKARSVYEFLTGFAVGEVGFVEHDNGLCGASPDGLLMSGSKIEGALEIKCHTPEKHALYLLDPDKFEDDHKHQLHWQLAIIGCKWVDLFGYCPNLPFIKRRVWRSAYTERFVDAIDELSDEYKAAIDQYNAIYAKQREELAKRKTQAA